MVRLLKHKYKAFFGIIFVLFILGSPNLLLATMKLLEGNFSGILKNLYHFAITTGLFLSPLLIVNFRIKPYAVFLSFLSFFTPIILFIVLIYKKLPNKNMFYVLFELEKVEILEFLSGLWLWLAFLFIIPLSTILLVNKTTTGNLRLRSKKRIYISVFYLSIFLLSYLVNSQRNQSTKSNIKFSTNKFLAGTPAKTVKLIIKARKAYKLDLENFTLEENIILLNRGTNSIDREINILVLGESSRYKNWGINGYLKNTSPLLSKTSDLISYKNVISPYFSTSSSIPVILSTANAQNLYAQTHTSLISIFKQHGFKTYWLSNQSSNGSVMIDKIANQADFTSYSNRKKDSYDEVLIEQIQQILDKKDSKVFIVVHTIGNHYPYQNRYPDTFNKFTPSLKKNKHIPLNNTQKQAIINSYDNSILYTDYFLSELIKLINTDSTLSTMTFVSDHGENLFDDQHIGFGRGFGKISTNLFHVPLFIWASEKRISMLNNKWNTLIHNSSKKCTTESLIHTIVDISEIPWSNIDSTKSLADIKYKETIRYFRLKQKFINYDNYFKNELEK